MTAIVAPVPGDLADPTWASDITDAVNTLLGGLQTWVPALTNITQGSGTVIANWAPLGPFIWWRFKFLLAGGSAMGSVPTITLPFAPSTTYYALDDTLGETTVVDSGVNVYTGVASFTSGSSCKLKVSNASGTYLASTDITAAIPHAWGSGDALMAKGIYIPA